MIRRDVNCAKIHVDGDETSALNLCVGEDSIRPGAMPAAAASAPRPIPPPRPAITRPAVASLETLAVEVKQRFDELQAAAILADERAVRRYHRQWIGWIRERQNQHALAAIVVVDAARLHNDTLALILAEKAGGEPIVEFVPTSTVLADVAPWPQLPLGSLPDGQPLDLRLILVRDPAGLANRPDLVNHMRREAALALVEQSVIDRSATDLFDFMPAATLVVGDGEVTAPRRGDAARGHIVASAPAGLTAGALIDLILPAPVRVAARPLVAAADLIGLADAIEQQAGARRDGDGGEARPSLVGERDLAGRLERLTAAKVEMASAIKACVANLRKSKQEIDSAAIVAAGEQGQFGAFLANFEPHSAVDIDTLMTVEPRRTWWEGTWLESLKSFFNRKARHSLDPMVVNGLIDGVQRRALAEIGTIVQRATEKLDVATRAIEQVYAREGIEEATRNRGIMRISQREVLGTGGANARSPRVESIRQSVSKSFEVFARKEAAAFYVDIEEKGVIGQMTDARSGVFGIFFILLFFARPFQRAGTGKACETWDKTGFFDEKGSFDINIGLDCLGHNLSGPVKTIISLLTFAMILVTIASYVINRRMRERRSRLALIERFEPRVEELRNKTGDLVDRVVREEIARFELETEDQGAVADATFDRLISEVKAQIDDGKVVAPGGLPRSAASTSSALASPPPRPAFGASARGSVADECRKLQEKLREAYVAQICQGAA